MLNGSKIITQNDLNIILRRFTGFEKINQKQSESCNKNNSIKRKHRKLETSLEKGTKSVKLEKDSLKNESVIENTEISILYEDINKLKKENKNLRENIEKISQVVNNYANNFERLSQIQNLLISGLSNTQIVINSSPREISRPLDQIFFEIKNKMGCGQFNYLNERNKRRKIIRDIEKRRKIIRDIERKNILSKKSEQNIKSEQSIKSEQGIKSEQSIKSETKNLVKNEKVPMAKIIVKSMDELDKKFKEYNNNNVGGFITYVASNKMEEMLNKTFKIVKRKGSFNEDGLIGLRPPEKYKDTRGWQNGCWFFPKTCVEEIFLN